MRGDQLARIVRPHLDGRLVVRVVPFHAGLLPPAAVASLGALVPRGAVIVFVKSAAKGLSAEHLAPLRRRTAAIGLDSIDTPIGDIDFQLFDFHIAASLAAQRALRDRLAELGLGTVPVEILHHHPDQRLRLLSLPRQRPFHCAYLGAPENAAIPEALDRDVEILPVAFARDMARHLPRLAAASLHFAVRPEANSPQSSMRGYKPFTKGFTAAACKANVLVNRGADDAAALLGSDYPFLVDSSEPRDVTSGFEHAREAYGTPLWAEALERMRALDALVEPRALAARLCQIVDHLQ